MQRDRNPTVGTTVSDFLCSVRVRSVSADPKQAAADLDNAVREVEARLGPIVFGRDDTTLQAATVKLLIEQGVTLATAESCTGGLIGGLLTDVAGSSAAYVGGWVTYTNRLKQEQLGVPELMLEEHGAVSEAVVMAMAEGARQRSGADFAVSVSGIAGPDGGTAEKPVGTVWMGLAGPNGTIARLARLAGDRSGVRDRAAKCVLQMLRLTLLNESLDHLRWLRPQGAEAVEV
jgi:nicotinamide-nucleotide amidase